MLLCRTEDEIGEDNIRDIDVPRDLHEKFQKMDEDFIKDWILFLTYWIKNGHWELGS